MKKDIIGLRMYVRSHTGVQLRRNTYARVPCIDESIKLLNFNEFLSCLNLSAKIHPANSLETSSIFGGSNYKSITTWIGFNSLRFVQFNLMRIRTMPIH